MTSDLDIYRSAAVLIREHGDNASLEAAPRADGILERGDVEGLAAWKRIKTPEVYRDPAVATAKKAEPRRGAAALRRPGPS